MEKLPYSEWGFREYLSVFAGLAVAPNPRAVGALRDALAAILSGHTIFPVNRARNGLRIALQLFREIRPSADEVIVPAYICPSVVEAVEACGLRIAPVDIGSDFNLDLLSLERAITPATLAVIAVHMYGCPAQILAIEALCRDRNVFLIDDAAQVLGVSTEGRPLGTFGDIGIVSFSQSKTIVAGARNAGGILAINKSEFKPAIESAWGDLPTAGPYRADVARFLWDYKWRRWTNLLNRLVRKIGGRKRKRNAQPGKMEKMNSLTAGLALAQLESLPRRIAGRKRVADLYHQNIRSRPHIGFPQYAPGRYLTRIVLTLPAGANLAAIRAELHRAGIPTRKGYPVYTAGGKPPPVTALELEPRLIELPSHSRMSGAAIEAICDSLDKALGRHA